MNFLMFEDLKPDWTSDCRQAYEGLNRRTDDLNQQNVEMFVFHLLMFAVGSIIIIIMIIDSSILVVLFSLLSCVYSYSWNC